MSSVKEVVTRQSCFQPGSTLCTGCMESVAFQNTGKILDNGQKTIYTMGTFCGEVSTLSYPDGVSWGRGTQTPEQYSKSFSILHNVFESSQTVAEAIRDVADVLTEAGAFSGKVQVVAHCGDGAAVAIGLRGLLHTIYRRSRIIVMVLVNEMFANTGFQYSPASALGSDTSTTPVVGKDGVGNPSAPLNYLHLCVAAGAGLVAQVSPAFPKYFLKVMEKAVACPETSVIFVPSPCITGWKFEEGNAVKLARLGAETGFFPCFLKEKGKKGEVKFVERDLEQRPPIELFMGQQRRFQHLVAFDRQRQTYVVRPEAQAWMNQIREVIQDSVERLFRIADLT